MAKKPKSVDPDADLVKRAQDGETRAFDELIMKYSRKLYGLVYNMTSNKEDTHDLLQDIFAKAYRSLGRFRGNSMFYTWIYSIAVNMTLNFLKKRKRRAGFSSNINELQKKLNEAMQTLSEQHRTVVTMFDIQGMPHAEISQILGVSEGTVRSRLYYAHQQLQGYLEEFLSPTHSPDQ
jgi:RNA polymerase sigma-70 factor (ECF subfamily)